MSFGRTEEEKSRLEEERLMKMFGGSKLQPEKQPPVKKQASLVDQTKLSKVLDAQGYINNKPKEPENTQAESKQVTSKVQNPILGEMRVASFTLSPDFNSRRNEVQVETSDDLRSTTLFLSASKWEETVTIILTMKFECKHEEKDRDADGTEVKRTVTVIQGIGFPFELSLDTVIFKPNYKGLSVQVTKPTF